MRERAVRTRRERRAEEKGARKRTCQILRLLHPSGHETRPLPFTGRQAFLWSEPVLHPWFSRITRHETRITAFYRVLRPSGGETCRLGGFLPVQEKRLPRRSVKARLKVARLQVGHDGFQLIARIDGFIVRRHGRGLPVRHLVDLVLVERTERRRDGLLVVDLNTLIRL